MWSFTFLKTTVARSSSGGPACVCIYSAQTTAELWEELLSEQGRQADRE